MTDSIRKPTQAPRSNGPSAPAPRQPSAGEREWEEKTLAPTLAKSRERSEKFTTVSSYPINRLYTDADLAGWSAARDLNLPGEPPYTRGIHPTMYRESPLDHAPVRRLRLGPRHQRALPLLALAGPDRPLRRLRSPHPDGLRLRTIRSPKAKWANAAWPSARSRTWKCSSIRFRSRASPLP